MTDHDPPISVAVAALTDFVAVLDATGAVRVINDFGLRLVGREVGEVVGTSITAILHPDDVARAVMNIGRVLDPATDLPVTPAFYRVLRPDGTVVRIEVNGARSGPPHDPCFVLVCRPTTDADLQERLIELLTGDGSSTPAFALLPEFPAWRQPDLEWAVFHLDDGGAPAVAGSALLGSLGDLDDPCTPWARASRTGREVFADVEDLGPEFAARARAVGLTRVRARPVEDRLFERPAVVVSASTTRSHRLASGDVLEITGYVLDRFASATALVVAWRAQVGELRLAAATDPLTGLANRAGFWRGLEQPADAPLALVCLDLDGFKAVNDTHGHVVGDHLLIEVAARLRRAVRPGDVVARLGGDEFAVVTTMEGSASDVADLARRLRDAVTAPFDISGRRIRVGASVGWSMAPAGAVDPDRLLEDADAALYAAKPGPIVGR